MKNKPPPISSTKRVLIEINSKTFLFTQVQVVEVIHTKNNLKKFILTFENLQWKIIKPKILKKSQKLSFVF
jgi:hypothetical protein